jgi:hypothetical protein
MEYPEHDPEELAGELAAEEPDDEELEGLDVVPAPEDLDEELEDRGDV